ncbi:uncharacterized protein Hap1MRO34_023503 isoform 1-T2 [Clarias gariepinus]
MGVTGLTCLIISKLIYHLLPFFISSSTADGFQTCPKNLTQYNPYNVSVQLKNVLGRSCPTVVNMTCCTNLPLNLSHGFEWWKDQNKINNSNQNTLSQNITGQVKFTCIVLSQCGNFSASMNQTTNCSSDHNGITTVLLICAVGAIFVILMFGITMKVMLKRGEVQRQARRQQRQVVQNSDSTATVTSTW